MTHPFTRSTVLPLLLAMLGSIPLAAMAQDDGTNGPPKVLVIHREFTKPGKEGSQHERTETAYIQGVKANKGEMHYLAMTSLSGPNRALFFSGYPSFGKWEQEAKEESANAALTASMDRTNSADGELLSNADDSVWVRRDDLSLGRGGITGARFMQISEYIIRPGHTHEWEELVKLVSDGYRKGVPEAAWTTFEIRYGAVGNAYLVVTPIKTGGEVDQMLGSGKPFEEAMGEDGMKKLETLAAACVQSQDMNLFAFSPKMSNPPEAWVAAEPDYWSPRAVPVKKSGVKAARAAGKPAE